MATSPSLLRRVADAVLDALTRPSVEARLLRAVRRDDVAQLEALLDRHGWALDTPLETLPGPPDPSDRLARRHGGWRLLHAVARLGSLEAAELLVARGAEVDALTDWLVSPAWLAARRGAEPLVGFLVTRGASLERRLPNLSRYAGEGSEGPSVTEALDKAMGRPSDGGVPAYARARAFQLDATLPAAAAALTPARPRL